MSSDSEYPYDKWDAESTDSEEEMWEALAENDKPLIEVEIDFEKIFDPSSTPAYRIAHASII